MEKRRQSNKKDNSLENLASAAKKTPSLRKKSNAEPHQEDPRFGAIGNRIKSLRISRGYTSAEIFAYEHDLNRISYWRMEKGSNITISSLLRILDIHQISLSEFFKDLK